MCLCNVQCLCAGTENIASVAEYSIDKAVEEALTISKNIYMYKYINDFLNADYDSHLAFYEAYQDVYKRQVWKLCWYIDKNI